MAKTIKTTVVIQYAGIEVTDKDILDRIKKKWVASKKLLKEIDTLDVYVKPEEGMVYYVVNGVGGDDYCMPIVAEDDPPEPEDEPEPEPAEE